MPRSADATIGRHPAVGGVFIAAQFLALNAIGLFATAYMIRGLGPLAYGQWATAAALASAHLLFTSAGLRTIFVRDVARQPERAGELLASQLALRLTLAGFAAASALVVCLVFGYPSVVFACTAVWCGWIVMSVVASTLGDVLQALERFGRYSATSFASGVAVTLSAIVAVRLGCGPIGLSIAYLAAPLVGACLSWRNVKSDVVVSVRWNTDRARALMHDARLLGLNHVTATVRDRAEQLLVPRLVGLAPFGIFSAGAMVGDRLSNVPDAVCTAFYPRISRAAQGEFGVPLERTIARMLSVGLAASLPLAILGTYLAPCFAAILVPTAQETCRAVIEITVWSVPLTAISMGMSFALQAAGHHDCAARRGLSATAISAAVSIVLTTAFGVTGASCAVVFRSAIVVLALWPSFRRAFRSVVAEVPLARILLCTALLASVCILGERHRVWPALLCAATGSAAYGLALLASGVVPISIVRHLAASTQRVAVAWKS